MESSTSERADAPVQLEAVCTETAGSAGQEASCEKGSRPGPVGPLLNFGCGRQPLPGFVNIDIAAPCDLRADARQPFPFEDASVRGVYSEHFLEHLTQTDGIHFLRECRRVLTPGGRARIAMPDLDSLVQRYESEDWRGDGDMFRLGFDWVQNRCEMLNIAMREWGHFWVYNEDELRRLGQLAGLRVVDRVQHGESEWPEFRGLETRVSSKLIVEFERQSTLETASEPLVSLLIPAYNPRFFRQALESALAQTWRRLEIIVCDDDSTGAIRAIVSEYERDERLQCFVNETRQGGLGNYLRCFEAARGDYVKFLNDDDLLEPECVARMVAVYQSVEGVRLVTSRRRCIGENGEALGDLPGARPIARADTLFEGRSLASVILRQRLNFIGEPSSTMFRKQDLHFITPQWMSFGGSPSLGAGDVAAWLNLMSQGDVVYLADTLSSLRLHGAQRQHDADVRAGGEATWDSLVWHGRRLGLLASRLGWTARARSFEETTWSARRLASLRDVSRQARRFSGRVVRRLRRSVT